MESPKMIVFGLDGASWHFLHPWLEDGSLPTLRAIRDDQLSGPLESCLPPVTSPNWKCFSTGKQPGSLGVYWWETLDWTSRRIRTPQSVDFNSAELWDYLGEAGYRSLVINMPTTYPPRAIEGTLIAGGPATGETEFTHPESLGETLWEKHDYRAIPENIDFIQQRPQDVVEEIRRLMRLRFTVAEQLMERESYDYVQVTLFLINVLQHHFGHAPPVKKAWKWIDRTIERWQQRFPEVPFLLVSDHGCNEIDVKFNVNQWLIQEGLLRVNEPADQKILHSLGLNKDRVARWMARLGVKPFFKRLLPENVRNWLPTEEQAVRASGKNRLIKWEPTRAYAFSQGPIFLNPALASDQHREDYERLRAQLSDLTGPEGTAVCKRVVDGGEYYGKDARGTAPDLVIDQAPGVHITGSIGFPDIFQKPGSWVAENARTGIYAWFNSPRALKLADPVTPFRITDLAPSILAFLIEEIPDDMDGKPRVLPRDGGGFRTRSALSLEEVRRRGSDRKTRERLEGIGSQCKRMLR